MLPQFKSVASLAALLGILALATDAPAEPKTDSSRLIPHELAEDIANGATPTSWRTHRADGSQRGDIAVLRVHFAPEPEGWLLLATGLSLLAVLHHSGAGRARRDRRSQRR